jgi:hypothetical protein
MIVDPQMTQMNTNEARSAGVSPAAFRAFHAGETPPLRGIPSRALGAQSKLTHLRLVRGRPAIHLCSSVSSVDRKMSVEGATID